MANEPSKPEEWVELQQLGESLVPTPEELAEARMLAVAADGNQHAGLSEDARLGLGLLRVASEGRLSRAAEQHIWDELALPKIVPAAKAERFMWFERKWLIALGMVPAAAAVLVYWRASSMDQSGSLSFESNTFPEPSEELLLAQAKWVTSNGERDPFEQRMTSYRLAVLEGLE
jgi:hypothetical protein